jgi:hypothetical protein
LLVESKGCSVVSGRTTSVTVPRTRPDVHTTTTSVWTKPNASSYNRMECATTTNVEMVPAD